MSESGLSNGRSMTNGLRDKNSSTKILLEDYHIVALHEETCKSNLSSDQSNGHQSSRDITNICCIGAGYVGGPTMAVIALKCPNIQVHVIDSDEQKIMQWNSESIPIYEPQLDEVIHQCRAVNTPTKLTGVGKGRAADLKSLEQVSRMVAQYSRSDKIIVEKSTVPVKAGESIKSILEANKRDRVKFEVLSNPEFMAEGTAIEDLLEPDRVLVGGDSHTKSGCEAIDKLKSIYLNWIDESKIVTTNIWSSELSKLAANAFLAQRLSSINALATICESTGADVDEVSRSIGLDSRIGLKYLKAGIGFGGSCFQKDVLNLVYLSECLNLPEIADYWYKVIEMNDYQRSRFARRIVRCLHNTLDDKKLAIFGFAFKANTGDTRESSAKYVCRQLLEEKAKLRIYDPKVPKERIRIDLNYERQYTMMERKCEKLQTFDYGDVETFDNPYECVAGCHAVVICTDWDEFRNYDYTRIYNSMAKPAIVFDGRRLLDARRLKELGFEYESVGSGDKQYSFSWI